MVQLRDLRLRAVRACIAEVASAAIAPERVGTIRLHMHQRLAVSRVVTALEQDGGCLLADDVGRGKTFVALAVARSWARPLLVVPASLRRTWQQAMQRADVSCTLVTHEALSRGRVPSVNPDGVIVDESHRFRSPGTRRHDVLARVAAHARVLLLSATPIQNGRRDLATQLALFLGSAAYQANEACLANLVIRDAAVRDDRLPSVAPPKWLPLEHDDGPVLREILALPRPARAVDTGDAGVLRTLGLVRAWGSSRAALAAAIRQRRRVAIALEQCAAAGLAPRRKDLRAWQAVGQDVQLTLAPLLVPRTAHLAQHEVLASITAERKALDRLVAIVAHSPDPDLARLAALRALREEHRGARMIAFSEFATTVRAYHALLRSDAGVGMLTATEARIASGRISRDALLDRFAPVAQGTSAPAPREQVTLLLTTDLLSEGVNLQDASVVVHLDLPWNPARLAQRLGRVRRPGGSSVVHSVLMAPPARAELLLRVEQRLRSKLASAERTIGRSLAVLPALVPSARASATGAKDDVPECLNAELLGVVARQLTSWRRDGCSRRRSRTGAPLFAALTGTERGWLAVLDDGRLIARCGASPIGAGAEVVRSFEHMNGVPRPCIDNERTQVQLAACEWIAHARLESDCGLVEQRLPLYDALERRMTAANRRAPRHQRPLILALASRLRDGLRRPPSLGMERELERLLAMHARGTVTTMEWLEQSVDVATRRATLRPRGEASHVVAAIVFGEPAGAQ